jgi:hypothetical protein
MRNAYKILVGKLKARRLLETLAMDGCIVENILKGTGCEIVYWIKLIQDKVRRRDFVNTTLNLRHSQKRRVFSLAANVLHVL